MNTMITESIGMISLREIKWRGERGGGGGEGGERGRGGEGGGGGPEWIVLQIRMSHYLPLFSGGHKTIITGLETLSLIIYLPDSLE